MTSLVPSEMNSSVFNLSLGALLFSNPQRDRDNAIVVANHQDITAGIEANDLLRIDFTVNTIEGEGGLYVITQDDEWIGYRFFQCMPNLHMRDNTGCHPVTEDILKSIKVVGRVKDIYRSRFN
ncbi:MAG: hypothetical protein CTY38_06060 [Methylotenera sp.]|uniref:hypothetical protein n=1 Tax=Methylotenera sp. TaxID=2051956 RepID=UPI000D4DA2E3|nr:hypothetical protein [Methylotenera sp.]PPC82615.1 MAG: hypothetical protein CTY38_06060 [Methylotenera sp.]